MQFYKYCPWDGYRFSDTDQQCFICKGERIRVAPQEVEIKKKWEKILYEQQEYEDNYIDETFLANVKVQNAQNGPDYKILISKSADIIFAINSVVAFLIIFHTLLSDKISIESCVTGLTFVTFFGGLTYILLTQKTFTVFEIISNIKNMAIIIALLYGLSPIMQTVNQTYSDDTIYTLTTVCVIFHLLAKDYDYDSMASPSTWIVDSSTYASLMFASLLASRLNDPLKVFIMLFSQMILFIFAIFFKKSVKDHSPHLFKVTMISISIIICAILYMISSITAFLYFVGIFFITFISPLWIIWLYQYKNTILGPWDLPKVKQYN